MTHLGHVANLPELNQAIAKHSLEFVDSWSSPDGTTITLRFVRYEAGARDGKFHHYASLTTPKESYELWKNHNHD